LRCARLGAFDHKMALRTALLFIAATASTVNAFTMMAKPLPSKQRAINPAMQFGFGGGGGDKGVPKGWKKVPSTSRPGEFSYLNTATGKRYDRLPMGMIYDDEVDTVSKPLWRFDAKEKQEEEQYQNSMEAAGFAEDGSDLANTGGVLYLAFVPFLLFAGAYVFGGVNIAGSFYGGSGNF